LTAGFQDKGLESCPDLYDSNRRPLAQKNAQAIGEIGFPCPRCPEAPLVGKRRQIFVKMLLRGESAKVRIIGYEDRRFAWGEASGNRIDGSRALDVAQLE
jgi:hypothetical protein